MKNLVVNDIFIENLNYSCDAKQFCLNSSDNDNCEVYVCDSNLKIQKHGKQSYERDISEFICGGNAPVGIAYLSLVDTVCLGLENGEIFTIVQDNSSSVELAGVCENGIQVMEWSPDQELLVLVTKINSMILMSSTFDPIVEVSLLDHEFGEKAFITVGWGSKETQFHGSEGKQAAKAKIEVVPDEVSLTNQTPKISWRGDGQLYAVSFILDGIRMFKVFDHEGLLQYTSEKQQGLEWNLAWRPSGEVIASTQRLPNKYVVAFFEKNGLKHHEFTIPVGTNVVAKDLVWSSDSEIIAIHCYDKVLDETSVLLFTCGNYHWYLKQTLCYGNTKIAAMMFDAAFEVVYNKRLHVFLDTGVHKYYNWNWRIDHSFGKNANDNGVVAVIDGSKLLITAFRHMVVPPPMATQEIIAEENILSVTFAPESVVIGSDLDTNAFMIDLGDKLCFYKLKSKKPIQYVLYDTFDMAKVPIDRYSWRWLDAKTIICITYSQENVLEEFSLDFDGHAMTLNNKVRLESRILNTQNHPNDPGKVFIQSWTGDVFEYSEKKLVEKVLSLPLCCPKLEVVSIDGNMYFIGLSYKNTLSINETQVMTSVSSFFVHTHFLLVTTLQHVLLCTELSAAGIKAISDHQKNPSPLVYKRNVERGSKLVMVVPNCTKTIFQLPRGNLETIQPRPLSLKIIGEYLDAKQYFAAFDVMRKQRINLNLFYDHNPDEFVANIESFVNEIEHNSWLSLFLTELDNVDVTKTVYASSYVCKVTSSHNTQNKITRVCEIVRNYLNNRADRETKILPIMTTYVKQNTTEDLEKALSVIKELKTKEDSGQKPKVSSDEALKYLLYMIDVNTLFDIALGMCDFDLVVLIAKKSQKDPKEYLPMLEEFNSMEENYKKFSINKYLKRFVQAVESLCKCGPDHYDELKSFVKYHSLYREAIRQFSPHETIYRELSEEFGQYLKLRKEFAEAGFVYKRGGSIEKAVECFKEALEWEFALSLAANWPRDQLETLCWDLVRRLQDEKRHADALTILERHCSQPERTVAYAVESRHFKAAIRLCAHYNLPHLIDSVVAPAVVEEHKVLMNTISETVATFSEHRQRLRTVLAAREAGEGGDAPEPRAGPGCPDADLYSDAGTTTASTASRSSGRTFRSSKNKRKHERKLVSLRAGSRYEDVALVGTLHALYAGALGLRAPARRLLAALAYLDREELARALQESLGGALRELGESAAEIWTPELLRRRAAEEAAVRSLASAGAAPPPPGISAVDPHLLIAPSVQEISWRLEGL